MSWRSAEVRRVREGKIILLNFTTAIMLYSISLFYFVYRISLSPHSIAILSFRQLQQQFSEVVRGSLIICHQAFFVLFCLVYFFFLTGRRKKCLPLLRSLGFQRACQNLSEDLQRRKAVRKRPENLNMPERLPTGYQKEIYLFMIGFLARLP